MISRNIWVKKEELNTQFILWELLLTTQIRRRPCWLTQKTLSIVSIVILPYESSRNYAFSSIILYFFHIVNHKFVHQQTIIILTGRYNPRRPFAMSMYGIALILLIDIFDDCLTVQKWYGDNCNTVGSLDNLKTFLTKWINLILLSVIILPSETSTLKNIFVKKHSWFLLTTKWK